MIRRLSFGVLLAVLGSIAFVPSAAAGGGCYAPDAVKLSSGDVVGLIAECAFQPTVNYIEPGDEITWTNKDPYLHTVTGAASSWGSDASISQGETVSYTFEDEGVYPFYCAFHPSMVGVVVVGDPTEASALTGGISSVDEVTDDTGSSSKEAAATPTSSRGNVIAFASLAFLGLAAVGIWRFTVARRRSVTATPAP